MTLFIRAQCSARYEDVDFEFLQHLTELAASATYWAFTGPDGSLPQSHQLRPMIRHSQDTLEASCGF